MEKNINKSLANTAEAIRKQLEEKRQSRMAEASAITKSWSAEDRKKTVMAERIQAAAKAKEVKQRIERQYQEREELFQEMLAEKELPAPKAKALLRAPVERKSFMQPKKKSWWQRLLG